MSNRLVLGVLLIAILLGAGMLWFMSSRGSGGVAMTNIIPTGERLAVIEPASLQSIVITWPMGTPSQRLTRAETGEDGAAGVWTVSSVESRGKAAGDQATSRAWRLEPDRVAGFLRLLQQSRTVAEPSPAQLEQSTNPGDGWHTIELIPATAATPANAPGAAIARGPVKIKLSTRVLGGQVLATVSTPGADATSPEVVRWAVVSDELMRVVSAGAMLWRQTAILPALLRDCVGVRISAGLASGATEIRLSKLSNIWRITSPVSGTADGAGVDRVLATLQGLTIVDFLDSRVAAMKGDASADSAWLASPTARVVIERAARDAQGQSTAPRVTELLLGPIADASGASVLATIDAGKTVVAVDAKAFAALGTDGAIYLSRRSSDVAPADVGRVVFVDERTAGAPVTQTLTRSVDGWSSASSTNAASPAVLLDRQRGEEVNALIDALCKTEAQGVSLVNPQGTIVLGTLSLATPSGEPLDEFRLLKDSSGRLVVSAKPTPARTEVWRVYKDFPALVARWAR